VPHDRDRIGGRRYAGAGACALLATAGAVALWGESDWSRPEYLAVLVLTAVMCELVTIKVGRVQLSASHLPIALGVVLLGPVPGIVVAGCATAFDQLRRRPHRSHVYTDVPIYLVLPVLLGIPWVLAESSGWVEPGSLGFLLGAGLLASVLDVVNFLLVALMAPTMVGVTVRHAFGTGYLPVVPWNLILAGLAAGTAHATTGLGIEPLVGFATLLGVGQLALLPVERAERRKNELRAALAERDGERERVGWEVHDEALQVLLAAQQDLTAGRAGQADRLEVAAERLALGVRQLRQLLRDRVAGEHASVQQVVREAVERFSAAGVRCDIELAAAGADEALVAPVLRELTRNVEKHARASRVGIRLTATTAGVELVISDDGAGFDADLGRRRALEGHVGLAMVRRRVAEAGGSVELRSGPGEGTIVTIRLPVPQPAIG
jgi:signal transduction histidine kinase